MRARRRAVPPAGRPAGARDGPERGKAYTWRPADTGWTRVPSQAPHKNALEAQRLIEPGIRAAQPIEECHAHTSRHTTLARAQTGPDPESLMDAVGLSIEDILKAVRQALKRKA